MISRRDFVAQAAGLALAALGARRLMAQLDAGPDTAITVYKSASCGCCAKWVDHLKSAGFKTVVHEEEDMDTVKESLGVPREMRSCHTGQVDKYLIEGHVPADDIRKLLAAKPKAAGLAAPGMPASSPGMAVPGEPHEPYEVLLFQRDGKSEVFARR